MSQLTISSLLFLLIQGAEAFQISPAQPRAGEALQLTVRRTFSADCQWRVTPSVVPSPQLIEVTLELESMPFCDEVETAMTFEVAIGNLAQGEYLVAVSWSDTGLLGLQTLRVAPPQGSHPVDKES